MLPFRGRPTGGYNAPPMADDAIGLTPTPAILIDAAIARRNLDEMSAYVATHGLKLRPHTKTHKSVKIGAMQMERGAIGLTVAKVGEALVMAEVASDLLMAYPGVDRNRCEQLAQLARSKTVRVAVDSSMAADALADATRSAGSTIGILVDLDVGQHRTGVQTPADALHLAQHVSQQKGLRLDGVLFFPGHIAGAPATQEAALRQLDALLDEILRLWRENGLEAKIVSGGSTPTALRSHFVRHLTEIRPGTYVYNDMNCVHGGCAELSDCAARIISTVVSTAVPGQIVLDAGSKTLTSDRCGPASDSGHGFIVEYPEAKITKLSEEHAQVDVTRCDKRPAIGQRVSVIPNHICPCINLQDRVWWREPGAPPTPLTVDARGKVQ